MRITLRKMSRCYDIECSINIFCQIEVKCSWRRALNAGAQGSRKFYYDNKSDAINAVNKKLRAKMKKGYQIISD